MKNEVKKLLNMLVLNPLLSINAIFNYHYHKNKLQKQYILPETKILLRRGDY